MTTEQFVIQLVVQAGAVGISALLIVYIGRKMEALGTKIDTLGAKLDQVADRLSDKMDRLSGYMYKVAQRVDLWLDEVWKREGR